MKTRCAMWLGLWVAIVACSGSGGDSATAGDAGGRTESSARSDAAIHDGAAAIDASSRDGGIEDAAAPDSACETMLVARTSDALRSRAEVVAFVEAAARHGVDRVAVSAKMDEEGDWLSPPIDSGQAFYRSDIAPRAPGFDSFDALLSIVEEAHARDIEVIAWLPQFHDRAAIDAHPDWQMRALVGGAVVPYTGADRRQYFLDPGNEDARAYQRAIVVEVVSRYDVDGIVIDWVRYDGWNMDLGDATRARYLEAHGADPIDIDFTADNDARRTWRAFRAEIVASHVREVRDAIDATRAGVYFGVFVLPPEFVEVSQDSSLFADATDFIAPMLYFDDWSFPPSWLWETALPEVRDQVRGRAEIVPTLDEDWTDEQMRAVLGGIRETAPETRQIAWFAFDTWPEELVGRLAAASACDE